MNKGIPIFLLSGLFLMVYPNINCIKKLKKLKKKKLFSHTLNGIVTTKLSSGVIALIFIGV